MGGGDGRSRAVISRTPERVSPKGFTKKLSGTPAGPPSPTRDRGQDRDLITFVDLRLQPLLKANVLTADIDVDEAAQVAVLGDPLTQVPVGLEDGIEDLADGGARDLDLPSPPVAARSWVGIFTVTLIGR